MSLLLARLDQLSLTVSLLQTSNDDGPAPKKAKIQPSLSEHKPDSSGVLDLITRVDAILGSRSNGCLSRNDLEEYADALKNAVTMQYFKLDMLNETCQVLVDRLHKVQAALGSEEVESTGVRLKDLCVSDKGKGKSKAKNSDSIVIDSDSELVASSSKNGEVEAAIEATI
ncbi:hypothetical protein H0H92_002374 [Tricholoma furcatifolium]|nr:hypothetical protein H0H92_002374 [Tricholoma furcatifolium]